MSVPVSVPGRTEDEDTSSVRTLPEATFKPPEPVKLEDLIVISPVLVEVVVNPSVNVTAPPYIDIGPATDVAVPTVTAAVLVDLPICNPPQVKFKFAIG
jgi:hypothetical protein